MIDVEWVPSPNFRRTRDVSCIVIHATATDGIDSPLTWLCNKESGVSAHYLIGLDGKVYQLVNEADIAWHAGESSWRGKKNVNLFSIGIELVNKNDGKSPYPEKQIDACVEIVKELMDEYKISANDVVGHLHIAPGRKTDPAGFPWDIFRKKLAA